MRPLPMVRPSGTITSAYDVGSQAYDQDMTDILEAWVDRPAPQNSKDDGQHGFAGVIQQLGNVASDKAQHLRDNWQDEPAAKRYDVLAELLWSFAGEIDDI